MQKDLTDRNEHPELRENYRWFVDIQTRWNDNDQYGHVNNSVYHSYMEIAVMRFLFDENNLDVGDAGFKVFTVENMCRYHQPIKFPQTVNCGLRIDRLGRSSIRYGLGLFIADHQAAAATGYCVDVCVDPVSDQPCEIPAHLRSILETIVVSINECTGNSRSAKNVFKWRRSTQGYRP